MPIRVKITDIVDRGGYFHVPAKKLKDIHPVPQAPTSLDGAPIAVAESKIGEVEYDLALENPQDRTRFRFGQLADLT